jgi:hypothetical protein
MILLDPAPAPMSADVPSASDFKRRFVRDAHTLLAEGYARLAPASLAASSEESISGTIIERINEWFDSPTAPVWTKSYFVKPEVPVRRGKREGKRRPRIDVYVESSEARPRARFAFEAKRFYRSDSVAEYLGIRGLRAFLDGTHTLDGPFAGMLGFVQQGSTEACIERVREKLDAERRLHGLAEKGAVWIPVSLDPRIGTTWVSRHKRTTPAAAPDVAAVSEPPLDIYNSFLRCCALLPTSTHEARQPHARAAASGASAKSAESEGVRAPKGQLDLLSWRRKS